MIVVWRWNISLVRINLGVTHWYDLGCWELGRTMTTARIRRHHMWNVLDSILLYHSKIQSINLSIGTFWMYHLFNLSESCWYYRAFEIYLCSTTKLWKIEGLFVFSVDHAFGFLNFKKSRKMSTHSDWLFIYLPIMKKKEKGFWSRTFWNIPRNWIQITIQIQNRLFLNWIIIMV